MVFISFYIMQIVNCSVLCFSESVRPISGFSNGKTCGSSAISHGDQHTDRFLSSLFCCHIENISYLKYPVSKSSYVSPLGPGSGGPRLTPPHVFPLQPRSRLTFIFLFRSHSSLCWNMSASTFSCSSLLLWAMVCTAPSFIRGTFRPGHRKPLRPSPMI